MSSSDEDVYEVEKILGKQKRGREINYLVRWKGYSCKHDSWEPASNLTGCQDMIKKYNSELAKRLNQRNHNAAKGLYSKHYARSARSSFSSLSNISRSRFSTRNNSRFLSGTAVDKVMVRRLSIDSSKSSRSFVRFDVSRSDRSPCKGSPSSTRTSSGSSSSHHTPISAPMHLKKLEISRPQKVFKVSENKKNVKHWLSYQSPSKLRMGDHDYITRTSIASKSIIAKDATNDQSLITSMQTESSGERKSTLRNLAKTSEAFRNTISKNPINYQTPSTEELGETSATRKSTLRKGRVYQERLVLLQWRQNFVEIIFANTSRNNGLTPRFLKELSNALDAVAASKCSVVVVNTVGSTFCSGLDVQFLVESLSSSKNIPETAKYLAESVRVFVDKLIDFDRLLIAVVQGPAINLGCSMLTLFDIVYCSDKAWFWTPYVDMAQTPESCASLLFHEILGTVTANNMLLNSAKLTANEAKLRGFVTEVFPHDSLKRNTMALIEKCAKRSGEAIQISKSLIRSSNIHRLKQVNYYECSELAERWSSQDFLENLLKFITSENL